MYIKLSLKLFLRIFAAIVLVVAGIAFAQTAREAPDLKEVNPYNISPPSTTSLQSSTSIPGSVREAKACSLDISELCASSLTTRRNIPECLVDNKDAISASCVSYIKKIDNK